MPAPAAAPHPAPLTRSSRPRRRRGSVLIVALLLAALIALSLGTYLNLNLNSSRLARRSFNGFAALNLAETGAEEAVWSFNRAQAGDAAAWSGWTDNGTSAWRKFTDFQLGGGATGWVKVYVDTFKPGANARPKIYAQSAAGGENDSAAVRLLEVTLRRRSLFAGGLVAKDTIVFAGAVSSVDSWDSDPDRNPATAPVPYSTGVRRDNGSVGSVSVGTGAVLVNQASIWGYVATGGAAPEVGSGGTVRGADTPTGVSVDPRRVSTDFSAAFDAVAAPEDTVFIGTLPAALGTPGAKTRWNTPRIFLTGRQTLTIQGDVTLVLTAATGDAVSVTGNAELIVAPGASLTLYVSADVKLGGNGVTNTNAQPVSLQLYGVSTSPGGQNFQIAGNGSLKGVVYAPNGDVTLNGNGDIMGSVVARSIRLTGNAAFHYDEALAERDSNQPFSISKWRELTSAADRESVGRRFEGW